MNRNEQKPYRIDKIISESELPPEIYVYCDECKIKNANGARQNIRVVSVNGCLSIREFTKDLRDCLSRLEDAAIIQIIQLSPGNIKSFLEEIDECLLDFQDFTAIKKSVNDGSAIPPGSEAACHVFKDPVVRLLDETRISADCMDSIAASLHPFAHTWFRLIANQRRRFNMIELIMKMRNSSVPVIPKANVSRIILKVSVARFAALIRILHDLGLFGNESKTEICNIVCETFVSMSGEKISVKSFKNLFDVPDPKALEYWEERLQEGVEYVHEIYLRYHSN